MLDDGTYASITQLAEGEKVAEGYVGRLLRLTLLAPDITERILEGGACRGEWGWPRSWSRGRCRGRTRGETWLLTSYIPARAIAHCSVFPDNRRAERQGGLARAYRC